MGKPVNSTNILKYLSIAIIPGVLSMYAFYKVFRFGVEYFEII